MSNKRVIFFGTEKSDTEMHEIVTFINGHNEIYMCINEEQTSSFITLNKETLKDFILHLQELEKELV